METVNGVMDGERGGPPPPSPLTGCYLLIVVGEPFTEQHKDIILQRIAKGDPLYACPINWKWRQIEEKVKYPGPALLRWFVSNRYKNFTTTQKLVHVIDYFTSHMNLKIRPL